MSTRRPTTGDVTTVGLPVAGSRLDPGGDIGVSTGAVAPGQRSVGDVAGEDVLEEELALAGDPRSDLGQDELAVLEPRERVRRLLTVVEKLGDGSTPEHAPDDRGR